MHQIYNKSIKLYTRLISHCWLWSLIFQIERYYSVVFVTQVYCTLFPPALANSFTNSWYWVNRIIFPWYFPYKRKHCNTTVHGIILYWKRDCESMKRKCNSFAAGCIPSYFWTAIKGLVNFFVDVSHRLGEPRYICVSL